MDRNRLTSAATSPALKALGALLFLCLMLPAGYTLGDASTEPAANCLDCHAASADKPVQALLRTSHGRAGSGGNKSCVSCHGDSAAHAATPVTEAPTISFGPRWPSSPQQQVESCTGCHSSGQQMLWVGSVHDDEDLSCTSCHDLHVQRDEVLGEITQADVCYTCHARQRTQANLPSRHPIKEGRTRCSDCHNSHGSTSEFALVEPTLNDTCYQCHDEKRGPYLFEHAPAAEDCSICHDAHGAINDDLLRARGPFLCQQCHAAAFHPSTVYSGTGLPSAQPNQNMLGKNCMNCHSQVHGSNHPSGAVLTR